MKGTILLSLCCLFICGACSERSAPEASAVAKTSSNYSVHVNSKEKSLKVNNSDAAKKIIKTADINIEVSSFEKVRQAIMKDVSEFEAEVFNERYSHSDYRLSGEMTIKVLPENFKKLIAHLEGLALVVHSSKSGSEDVTDQFIDASTRLNTKRKMVAKYESYLNEAKNVEELLQVEQELRKLIEEIEVQQSLLNTINDRVGQSTISLSYWQDLPAKAVSRKGPSFISKVGDGLRNGWEMIQLIALFIVNVWPIVLMALVALFLFKKRRSASKIPNKTD